MGYLLQKDSSTRNLCFLMTDSTDHITGKTGLSPTVTLSKNGASFASPSGSVSEIGNGWYKVAGNATDTNTNGPLLLHATGTGADATDDRFEVVDFNPDNLLLQVGDYVWEEDITEHNGTQDSTAKYVTDYLNATVSSRLASASYTAPDNATISSIDGKVDTIDGIVDTINGNVDTTVSSRLASASYTTPPTVNEIADQVWEEDITDHSPTEDSTAEQLAGLNTSNLDATVSSRLATTGYTAPDNSTISSISSKVDTVDTVVDGIASSVSAIDVPTVTEIRTEMDSNSTKLANLDATVSSRLASADYEEGSAPTAQEIWEYSPRTLSTAVTEITTYSAFNDDSDLTIYRGDMYSASCQLALESFTVSGLQFLFITRDNWEAGTTDSPTSITCTYVQDVDNSTISVSIPFTWDNTSDLTVSPPAREQYYVYQLRAQNVSEEYRTILQGYMTVRSTLDQVVAQASLSGWVIGQ